MAGLQSGRVILGYARYLGIDPETEPTLVDIAREALSEPLPAGWEEVVSRSTGDGPSGRRVLPHLSGACCCVHLPCTHRVTGG